MRQHHEHEHGSTDEDAAPFEPEAWDDRYSGPGTVWSGSANPVLVDVASTLAPGAALDVGCGEGGDVVWLAQNGWRATGADFSAAGLARAASHAQRAGVDDRVDWWRVDARTFTADDRRFDLVTTHYLHPPEHGIVGVIGRLAGAVAPGGRLLVVGHAPTGVFEDANPVRARAMWRADDLVPALPEGFEVLLAEERERSAQRDGATRRIEDAVLLARRVL